MQQRGEPPRCLPSCCLPHAFQPLGHGCPLLRAVRAWPLDVLLGAVASLPLRLLGDVRVGRTACAFPQRPATSRQASPTSPGSRARSFLTCTGSRPRRVRSPLAKARRLMLPSLSVHKVGTRKEVFRGSIGGPPVPLSTLHPRCRHRRRMTRGQRSSLNFHCGALDPQLPAGLSRRFRTATNFRAGLKPLKCEARNLADCPQSNEVPNSAPQTS